VSDSPGFKACIESFSFRIISFTHKVSRRTKLFKLTSVRIRLFGQLLLEISIAASQIKDAFYERYLPA